MRARILIAVTHLLGTGHLARATAIASGLGAAGFAVRLVSGGMPAPTIGSGPYDFIQLPPVRVFGTDYANLLDEMGAPVSASLRTKRMTALLEAFHDFRPHVLITEHFPFGRSQLAEEFLALIHAARNADRRVFVFSSVRDVLPAPSSSARLTQIVERVRALFDAVLVHGDAAFLPLEAAWPTVPTDLAAKLIHSGYVAAPDALAAPALATPPATGATDILVSGGGSGAALPLFEAAIGAAHKSGSPHCWRILIGHGVGADQYQRLMSLARAGPESAGPIVERARSDFPALLRACAASVSQAGYNTAIDVVRARCPAVFVPYEEDDATDQVLRAQALAAAGTGVVCDSVTLSPETLLAAVERALVRGVPPAAPIKLDGVAQTAKTIDDFLSRPAIGEISPGRNFRRRRQGAQ